MRIGIVSERPGETEILRQAIALKAEHRIVWVEKSGMDAAARCGTDKTDLILMDLQPGTKGVDATRQIMERAPCAILIVTGNVDVNAARVFEAMGHGALDVVEMPAAGTDTFKDDARALLAKIATIASLIGEPGGRFAVLPDGASHPILRDTLVAIGASAGGPAALAAVLRDLPPDFPAAIVVIQHVEAQFASGMAAWLSEQSRLPVAVASEGDRPVAGRVLLAGTNDHLMLKAATRLGYTPEPGHYAYRPSIDVFFGSVTRLWRGDAVGVLLTGMGRDGALGLKGLRDGGHHTIAQDQGSSAVYGMPKAAAMLNAAVDILPMGRIASRLVELVAGKS